MNYSNQNKILTKFKSEIELGNRNRRKTVNGPQRTVTIPHLHITPWSPGVICKKNTNRHKQCRLPPGADDLDENPTNRL
jgi:hypothetical protein